jgi:hypothetical protein
VPITLGCPSCGKRFRARDESAGKRVKCPYCSAPVSVPTSSESAVAAAPTDALPKTPAVPAPPPGRPVPPPAGDSSLPNPFGSDATGASPFPSSTKSAPRSAPAPAAAKAAPRPFGAASAGAETPEQLAARGWRKARRGLGWVLVGLFFLALPAFAEFGKEVYARTQGGLPEGSGAEWVQIDGMVNAGGKSVTLSKVQIIDVAAYGIPLALAGLFLFLGRLRAGAVPRNSGAKSLFTCSGLFTLIALTGAGTYAVCSRLADQPDFPAKLIADYGKIAALICWPTAEFWFLTALTASGLALKRPAVARAVGLLGFLVALAMALSYVGWDIYVRELQPKINPPDVPFYESMALMIGWLLVVGVYWRAVSSTRGAIRDHLDTVGE